MATKKQKDFVMNCIDYWKPILKMQDWTIKVVFETEDEDHSSEMGVGATVVSNTNGRWCNIHVRPLFFDEVKSEQWNMILHELCHAITSEFADAIKDQWNGRLITQHHEYSINERTTN